MYVKKFKEIRFGSTEFYFQGCLGVYFILLYKEFCIYGIESFEKEYKHVKNIYKH